MTQCQVCHYENRPGEFYCQQCGNSLVTTVEAPAISLDSDALVCPKCCTNNRPGSQFCSHCGSPLLIGGLTPHLSARELRDQVRHTLVELQTPGGTAVFRQGEEPVLYIQGTVEPFPVSTEKVNILGRRSPGSGDQPTIDLTAFRGYDLGISRLHASISYENGAFSLRDLDSTNGTCLNGKPVPPDTAFVLNSGDEIRLGNLVCHIYF